MIDFRLVSCLEKVFEDEAPKRMSVAPEGLRGEKCAFQAAWRSHDAGFSRSYVRLEIESPNTSQVLLKYYPIFKCCSNHSKDIIIL